MKLKKLAANSTSLLVVAGIILTTALLGREAHAEEARSLPADVGEGRVAWFDLTSTNLAQSKEFYGKLFGWTFAAVPGSDQAAEISAGGTQIGTLRVADGKLSPFNGVVYVQVNDLNARCAKAKELGGAIAPGFPFDLPNGRGAIGLVLDPSGHPIGFYSRKPLPSADGSAK